MIADNHAGSQLAHLIGDFKFGAANQRARQGEKAAQMDMVDVLQSGGHFSRDDEGRYVQEGE